MSVFFAVPRSVAPRNADYGNKSFSDTFFLQVLQPHAITVEFDPDSEECDEIFDGNVPEYGYPQICVRWAEERGEKVSDYFFIINMKTEDDERVVSDVWPEDVINIVSWECIEWHCVSPARLNHHKKMYQESIDKIVNKLENLIY